MGERKGQNKYYPPDFDPRKHRSLDAYHGSHPLRERAKKLNQGILVIRFEMPYNIWCEGCGNHIGMGVRYNAEKSKIGNYYTTPIYKFRMKCHLCPSYIEIKTDPASHDYVIISGARRKEQRWDPKENEQIVTDDKALQKRLALDPMYRLDHAAGDKEKQKAARPGVAQLTELREGMKDDYLLNKYARNKFRIEKKMLKTEADEDKALLTKSSLDIALVAENPDDINMARMMKYRTVASFDEKQKEKRDEIRTRSIFTSPAESSSSSSETSTPDLNNTDNKQHRLQKLAGKLGINRKSDGFLKSFDNSGKVTPDKTIQQLVRPSRTATITKPTLQESMDSDCKDTPTVQKQAMDTSIPKASPAKSSALSGIGLMYNSSNTSSSDDDA